MKCGVCVHKEKCTHMNSYKLGKEKDPDKAFLLFLDVFESDCENFIMEENENEQSDNTDN